MNTNTLNFDFALAFIPEMKFFIFFVVVFFFAVKVNDEADVITHDLARGQPGWRHDHDRLVLYTDSLDKPISFYIAGVRMTREQLLFQLGVYGISLSITLLQSIVTTRGSGDT